MQIQCLKFMNTQNKQSSQRKSQYQEYSIDASREPYGCSSPSRPVKLPAASRGASLAQLEFQLRRPLLKASAQGG
jgi:hypothetical protein